MKLIKTSIFSGIITFIKIGSGFVASKVIAMITGPTGVAILGQFVSFLAVILTVANGAISNGVVKYTAEYENDPERLKIIFSTAFKISVYSALSCGIIVGLFATFFSKWILYSDDYANVFRALALTLVFFSVNTLIISILNGKKEIRIYTFVNTAGALFGLLVTVVFVYFFKISGALYAMVVGQTLVFLLSIFFIRKVDWFKLSFFTASFDMFFAKKLAGYGLIALVSALTVPVSQILLRNIIIDKLGIASAGYWQGMMRVSDGYLLMITTSINIYYLPKLSSLKTDAEIRKEIKYGFKIIVPFTMLGCAMIYFLRFFIIRTLYTPEFLAMEHLFLFQLLGDVMKVASLMLGYLLIAKSMLKTAMFTETIFSILWVVLGYFFITYFGLQGISIAFFINYVIYFLMMVFLFRKLFFPSS